MTFFRALFLLFVLANLLLFAYGQGYFGPLMRGEADRLAGQLAADKIRVVRVGTAPSGNVKAGPKLQPEAAVQAEAKLLENPEVCRLMSPLGRGQVNRIDALARDRSLTVRLSERPLAEPAGWWVFIPPQADRKAADERVAELKRVAFRDSFVVVDDALNRYAVSLGVFGTQRAANDFVQVVKKKGIEDVRVGPYISPDARRGLEVRGTKDVVDAFLGEVASELGDARAVACPVAG